MIALWPPRQRTFETGVCSTPIAVLRTAVVMHDDVSGRSVQILNSADVALLDLNDHAVTTLLLVRLLPMRSQARMRLSITLLGPRGLETLGPWTIRPISRNAIPYRILTPASVDGIDHWLDELSRRPLLMRTLEADRVTASTESEWEALARAFFERGCLWLDDDRVPCGSALVGAQTPLSFFC